MAAAAKLLELVVTKYPQSESAESALYQLVELHGSKVLAEYGTAIKWYTLFLEEYPESTKSACYHLAQAYDHGVKDRNKALEMYRQAVEKYPGSREAASAERRIKVLENEAGAE